jgi:acetoin utilization deacetylase AcuC-like enzyme
MRFLESRPMHAFHADSFVLPLPPGHSFPMGKYRLLREAVDALHALASGCMPAQPASDGELALAHDPGWITAVARGHRPAPRSSARSASLVAERMVERARRSVGATIGAARAALLDGEGVAANLAGGTHHAYAHKGSGYCVFNDVAVAARLMQAEWHRHGSGGCCGWLGDRPGRAPGQRHGAIFRDDPTVFTLSLHGAKNFPFRKEASDLDVDLPDGCADEPTCRRWTPRWPTPGAARRRRPAWCSTWPVPTRTKTTAWAG